MAQFARVAQRVKDYEGLTCGRREKKPAWVVNKTATFTPIVRRLLLREVDSLMRDEDVSSSLLLRERVFDSPAEATFR